MTTPRKENPKNLGASAHADALNAKRRRKVILSLKYIMKHMPEPCVSRRSVACVSHLWPSQPGLCGERKLTGMQVQEMTMMIIVRNKNPELNNQTTKSQYSPLPLLKAIDGYLPNGISIRTDWGVWKSNVAERCTDPAVLETLLEFEEWVEGYYAKIETALATMYIEVGDKPGKAYLEVLARRFRANWSTQQQVNVKADVDAKEKVDATINFNFQTLEGQVEEPHGSGH